MFYCSKRNFFEGVRDREGSYGVERDLVLFTSRVTSDVSICESSTSYATACLSKSLSCSSQDAFAKVAVVLLSGCSLNSALIEP
jgi:hypothetical protein